MRTRTHRALALLAAAAGGAIVTTAIMPALAQQSWQTYGAPLQEQRPKIIQVTSPDNVGIILRLWDDGRIEALDGYYLYPTAGYTVRWEGWRPLPN